MTKIPKKLAMTIDLRSSLSRYVSLIGNGTVTMEYVKKFECWNKYPKKMLKEEFAFLKEQVEYYERYH